MSYNHLSQLFPPLTPITFEWMKQVTGDHTLINKLFETYGSPLNLHNLEPFAENYKQYAAVLDTYELDYSIFFARKANKSFGFVEKAKQTGFGVDTASFRELNQCLDIDFPTQKLVLTAAIKDERLVQLALENEVLIILDNEDECQLVNRLAARRNIKAKVGLRISGFKYEDQKLYSRFGIDIDDAYAFVNQNLGPQGKYDNLQFRGFHFHLDGYSIPQRGQALLQTIALAHKLKNKGITTSFIDIGGGFLTNYLSEKQQWKTFWEELKKAVRGERPQLTFGNNGLGYELIDQKIYGSPTVYPYFNETPKADFLERVLTTKNKNGQTAASLLRQRDIELRMEPGRSLLDQTGMTVARVVHRKKDTRGNWLVGLQINRSQMTSSSADFLVDPAYIPLQASQKNEKPVAVYFTGAYCLEKDIILKRKIVLPRLPCIGDAVAFLNTAGYMMHFYETESHLLKKTTNLMADGNAPLQFSLDETEEEY